MSGVPAGAPRRAVPPGNTPLATSFQALGTVAHVAVADHRALGTAWRVVAEEIVALDLACSRFRPDSGLSAVNDANGVPVPVGDLLFEAVSVALRAARMTGGLVDPTLGAALESLGYDRDFARIVPDGAARVDRPALRSSWRDVALDRTARTVRVPAGVHLDLGATAKALGADRAARAAARVTGGGVLVSLGGDVAVAGPPPTAGWAVRIDDDSRADPGSVNGAGQTVALRTGGLATSSTTVRRWTRGGEDLHHILDPRTGWPARSPWRTVTVAAASCVEANTASTAAVVLGPEAPAWLEGNGLPARLVDLDGRAVAVCGWPPNGI